MKLIRIKGIVTRKRGLVKKSNNITQSSFNPLKYGKNTFINNLMDESAEIINPASQNLKPEEKAKITRAGFLKLVKLGFEAGAIGTLLAACGTNITEKEIKDIQEELNRRETNPDLQREIINNLPEAALQNTVKYKSIGLGGGNEGTMLIWKQGYSEKLGRSYAIALLAEHEYLKAEYEAREIDISQPQINNNQIDKRKFGEKDFFYFPSTTDLGVVVLLGREGNIPIFNNLKDFKISKSPPQIGERLYAETFSIGGEKSGFPTYYDVVGEIPEAAKKYPENSWVVGESSDASSGSGAFESKKAGGKLHGLVSGRTNDGLWGVTPIYKPLKRIIEGAPDIRGQWVNNLLDSNINVDDSTEE